MRIGMIGGGGVGQTLGAALLALGHEVVIGIRSPSPEELEKPRAQALPLAEWITKTGGRVGTFAEAAAFGEVVIGIRSPSPEELAKPRAQAQSLAEWSTKTGGKVGTFAEAAAFGEVVFNVTQGAHSVAALTAAGGANLAGKVLVDVANPLDFSAGMPPFLSREFSGPTSLGEAIQAAFPKARVVKAFNTVTASVMVNPGLIPGTHDLFLSGDDGGAKVEVSGLARGFGWTSIVDLGDIKGARAQEAVLPIWVRLWMTGGSPMVNLRVVRG